MDTGRFFLGRRPGPSPGRLATSGVRAERLRRALADPRSAGSSWATSAATALTLLCCGIAVATALPFVRAYALRTISHDDGISHLAATCHQEAYASRLPSATWVAARELKAFWRPEAFG